MTAPQSRIVAVARLWLGTPYCHQASLRGAGCDCLGLVRGVWREVHGAEPCPVPPYTPDWSEPQGEERLWAEAARLLRPGTGRPGDLLLFRMREGAVAKHLGILSRTGETPAFIHAWSGRGVVESPLSAPWARRIVALFDLEQGSNPTWQP
ncbi:putative phage cell wall peptidase, NlpC/P60 family [Rubellimicrobium thermophilum DSM 16684]|uniref:Putative phage cell wall peptidase, NlpC/P60 family n=1 Tax=Rubellimicrobium thermophilum DSM 16684 TaxID=1123069 RepID=S9SAU9_9RHOB|nr:NlpC/P60 family protein [Rubellimicrobium thermophilum]EPX87260.1 putative phage cell wall peptidase, NlpC/P60 family [Rubellimicrobium thermophilum DSM 16684]